VLSRYLGLLPATAEADALKQIVDLGVFAVNADGGTLLVVEPETSNLLVAITTGSETGDGAKCSTAGSSAYGLFGRRPYSGADPRSGA
jgi:hypothetical protein